MKRHVPAWLLVGILTTGCSGADLNKHSDRAVQPQKPETVVQDAVGVAAKSVERLLVELQKTKETHAATLSPPPNTDYLVSVADYTGDIEPLLEKITRSVGMGFRKINSRENIVIVTLNVRDLLVLEVFERLGVQAGTRADIIYKTKENVVELIYK